MRNTWEELLGWEAPVSVKANCVDFFSVSPRTRNPLFSVPSELLFDYTFKFYHIECNILCCFNLASHFTSILEEVGSVPPCEAYTPWIIALLVYHHLPCALWPPPSPAVTALSGRPAFTLDGRDWPSSSLWQPEGGCHPWRPPPSLSLWEAALLTPMPQRVCGRAAGPLLCNLGW